MMSRQARNSLEVLMPRLRRALGRAAWPDHRTASGEAPAERARPEEGVSLRDRVRMCFLDLAEDERDILHLICVEELSYREVAAIYATDVATVISRLVAARLALHDRLARDGLNQPRSAEVVE
jgi:RNA polymerase sigma-70 factor (ECF subfamily)